MLLHKSHGNKWTIIAEHMPGRSLSPHLGLTIALRTIFTPLFEGVSAGWAN